MDVDQPAGRGCSPSIDVDDVVVAELDVVFSNEVAALQSQLVMLQQPLRPNWRAYEADQPGVTARFKPHAKRLELSLPLDADSDNYNADLIDEGRRIKTLELRSTTVEDPTQSCALGVVRGSELVLLPLDCTLQLRPNMAHLAPGGSEGAGSGHGSGGRRGRADGGEESEEEEAPEELTAVEVTVKRRETERQQQLRLKSYSHLQQEEQAEAWVPLKVVSCDSAAAERTLSRLLAAPQAAAAAAAAAAAGEQQQHASKHPPRPPAVPLSRADYLASFVPAQAPGSSSSGEYAGRADTLAAAADTLTLALQPHHHQQQQQQPGTQQQPERSRSPSVPTDVLLPSMIEGLRPVIKSLFTRHSVCTMANVRQWLQAQPHPQAAHAAALEDGSLTSLLAASGHVRRVKRVFVARVGPHRDAQGLREVALDLLEAAGQMRKADLVKRAREAGVATDDKLYQKVTKELCKNNGSYWLLKAGADM